MVPYKPPHYHREARLRPTTTTGTAMTQHRRLSVPLLTPPSLLPTAAPPTDPPPTTGPPPAYNASPPPFRTAFASLVLYKADGIRMLHFAADDIAAMRDVIARHWPRGIQSERSSSSPLSLWSSMGTSTSLPQQQQQQQHEFKCHGKPWATGGAGAAAAVAGTAGLVLMRGILACLYSRGWILSASTRVVGGCGIGGGAQGRGQTVIVFRKEGLERAAVVGVGVEEREREWIALGFDFAGERVRMVGAPEELVVGVESVLKGCGVWKEGGGWKIGSQGDENGDGDGDGVQGDKVWEGRVQAGLGKGGGGGIAGEEAGIVMQVLVVRLLEVLEAGGWSLYASVDQNNASHGKLSCGVPMSDSWYCVRAVDWVPGNTVFHR